MGFDQNGFLPRASAPTRSAPLIAFMIDHLDRPGNVFRLKLGCRIGYVDPLVDPEFVSRARLDAGYLGGKPAGFAAPLRSRAIQQQVDTFCRRRPQPKCRAIGRQPCAELAVIHAEPAKASTERGDAFASLPDANPLAVCLASSVLSTSRQFLYSGIAGSLNAIASDAAFSTMKIGAPPGSTGPST